MNKNIFYRLIILAVSVLLITQLTGCQLAIEDTAAANKKEKLCGIFLTIGSDTLPVNQPSLEDVDFNVNKDGKITFEEKGLMSSSNKIEGQLIDNKTMKFNGVEGYFMALIETKEADGITSQGLLADNEFHGGKISINQTDKGEENSCEMTFFVGKEFQDSFYMNPIYQRGDGTYYTILGQAMGIMGSGHDTGSVYSQTLDNTVTQTVDGKTMTEKNSFKINVEVVDSADHIVIKEMNQKDELIKYTKYLPGDPEEFTVDTNTQYIIVEDRNDSDVITKRSIYSINKEILETKRVSHAWNLMNKNNIITVKEINFVKPK